MKKTAVVVILVLVVLVGIPLFSYSQNSSDPWGGYYGLIEGVFMFWVNTLGSLTTGSGSSGSVSGGRF